MNFTNQKFEPTNFNHLKITEGSFKIRLFIYSHPLFLGKADIEIFVGKINAGQSLYGGCFVDPSKATRISMELSPVDEKSTLIIEETTKEKSVETVKTLLTILERMIAEEPEFTKRLDENFPTAYDEKSGETNFISEEYFVPINSIALYSNGPSFSLAKNIIARNSIFDISKWMLNSNTVLLPKSLRFYVTTPTNVKVITEESAGIEIDTFNAITNVLISLHLNLITLLESKALRRRQNRKAALKSAEVVLMDYSGKTRMSTEDNRESTEISGNLVKCLHQYLQELNVPISTLTYPNHFGSDEPIRQAKEILNLSYIPSRVFIGQNKVKSRQVGGFIRFQGETFQLEYPGLIDTKKYPSNVEFDNNQNMQYLQIYKPLPINVRSLDFLACMLRGNYLELSIVLAVSAITAMLTLLPPIAITYLLSEIIPYSAVLPFIQIVVLLFVAGLITLTLQLLQSRYAVRLETKADINIQTAVTNRLLSLPASSIIAEDSGDLQSRVSYLSQLRQVFTQTITPLFTQSLTLIFNLGLLFWYSWPVALISLIPLGTLLFSAGYVAVVKGGYYKIILQNDGKIFAGLFRFLLGVIPFRTNLTTDFVRLKYINIARPLIVFLFRATRQGNRLNTLDATIRPLTYCFIFPLIVWCVQNNFSNAITLASFAGFSTALTTIFTSGRSLTSSTLGQAVQGWAIWQRSLEFLKIEPESTTSEISIVSITGKIEFRNVSFSYKDSINPTLENINFTINSGDFIGITGQSGCGKSTLMRIAYAVLTPQKGSVIYDTHNSGQFNQRELRSNFGVITQDVRLLNASLRDNILGGLRRSDQQISDVLERSCLTDFVASLPMGLETMLTERSTMVSMGQKQLILIARALLSNPKVLFMDEATSYLDQITEAALTVNIKSMGITRLAVAHRLSTIIGADKILFLDQGQVLGYDDHESLLVSLPEYKTLYLANSSPK